MSIILVPKVEIIRNLDDVKAFKRDDVEFLTEVSCAEVDGEWMIDNERIYMTDRVLPECESQLFLI